MRFSNATTDGPLRFAQDTGEPITFGVLTLDSEQSGLERAGLLGPQEVNGAEAAEVSLGTARIIPDLLR